MKKIIACCTILCSVLFAQAQITSIPFEMYGDHIIIKVTVDGSEPLDFIFDTGSGLTVIDKNVAGGLHLTGKKITMPGSNTPIELIKHNEIDINGFVMEKNIKIYAADLNHLEISMGRDIDGILGYDLMLHHTLHLDFDGKQMKIYEHGKGPITGDLVNFDLNFSIPTIPGTVVLNNGDKLSGSFFVMTGASTSLDFNAPYASANDIIHKTGKHFSYLVKDITDHETPHYEGHVQSFAFGQEVVEDLPIGISQAKNGIQAHPDVSGIIGNGLLSKYNFTIDLPGKKLYFEPNMNSKAPILVNSSGIDLQLSEDKSKVLIHKVYEDSPAEEAGIKVNDELLEINGKSIKQITFPEAKNIFKQKGELVDLKIKSGGSVKNITIKQRSLID